MHLIDEPTHGKHQTDHVIAFHDPLIYDVSAFNCAGVGDHDEMHVTIEAEKMEYEKPKWQRRKVVVDEGSPDAISMLLTDKLEFFDYKYIDAFPFMNQGNP